MNALCAMEQTGIDVDMCRLIGRRIEQRLIENIRDQVRPINLSDAEMDELFKPLVDALTDKQDAIQAYGSLINT